MMIRSIYSELKDKAHQAVSIPRLSVEVLDSENLPLLSDVGGTKSTVVAVQSLIDKIVASSSVQAGLMEVWEELLGFEGMSFYIIPMTVSSCLVVLRYRGRFRRRRRRVSRGRCRRRRPRRPPPACLPPPPPPRLLTATPSLPSTTRTTTTTATRRAPSGGSSSRESRSGCCLRRSRVPSRSASSSPGRASSA